MIRKDPPDFEKQIREVLACGSTEALADGSMTSGHQDSAAGREQRAVTVW